MKSPKLNERSLLYKTGETDFKSSRDLFIKKSVNPVAKYSLKEVAAYGEINTPCISSANLS